MNVRMERGGIIWQARQILASARHIEPLNADAGEFDSFAKDIANARRQRGEITIDQLSAVYRQLEQDSRDNPLGRVARLEYYQLSGNKLRVNLALLNESLGIMPRYHAADSDIRKIGRVSLFLHDAKTHNHPESEIPRHQSQLSGGYDILTDGSVYMTTMSLEICNDCPDVMLHDESRILHQLGFSALFDARQRGVVTSDYRDPYNKRRSQLLNQPLDTHQHTGLQLFLAEHFETVQKPTRRP